MGSFKLGKMTLRSLVRKPETVCYPLEHRDIPAGHRGMVQIDMAACILCGICQKRCPCDAITVDKPAGTWSINHFGCIQCDTCVRECPKDALTMSADIPHVAAEKSIDTYHKPEPSEEEKAAEAAKKAEREARIAAAKAAKAVKEAEAAGQDAPAPKPDDAQQPEASGEAPQVSAE